MTAKKPAARQTDLSWWYAHEKEIFDQHPDKKYFILVNRSVPAATDTEEQAIAKAQELGCFNQCIIMVRGSIDEITIGQIGL